MQPSEDAELLTAYATYNSEEAFAELVRRYVALVYSAALRRVRDPQLAEEVTQAVFIILARKARALSRHPTLSGWLCRVVYFVSRDALRTERRRRYHERIGTEMENTTDTDWRQIAPLLDAVVAQLNEKDRGAIVLRFYEHKSFKDVGNVLGVDADAAQKRVSRALEKLRKAFSKRGVTSTTGIIAGAISANSVRAAPTALAKSVAAVAMTKGATAGGSTLALVKGTLIKMTCVQLKFAAGVGVAVLLAGGAATIAISQSSGNDKLTPQQIAKQAQDAYAALYSYSDSGMAVWEAGDMTTRTTFNTRLQRPDLYRIAWTQTGGSYTSKGIAWSDWTGDYFVEGPLGQGTNAQPQKMNDMQQALATAGAVSGSDLAIPATFFNQAWGNALGVAALGRSQLKKEADEKAGDVDCYVFSSKIDSTSLPKNMGKVGTTSTTFWIGKRDHFIHQTRASMEGMSVALPPQSDANIQAILEHQNKPATPEAIAAWRTQMDAMTKQMQGATSILTQTHENISVNQNYSSVDFLPVDR
jgi:RNA polymerase sigma factor (sigma-70 family)